MVHAYRRDNGSSRNRQFWIGIARAFGGAIIFSLPLLMTMEMWYLGFYMSRLKLALFMVVFLPLLIALSYHSGFEPNVRWKHVILDAFSAYAVGFVASGCILLLFGVLSVGMAADEWIGKIALQAVSASIGASLARSELGAVDNDAPPRDDSRRGYLAEMILMSAGAVFLAFNVAPTDEMVLIAYMMTLWHTLVLALLSLVAMQGFVYTVQFRGQEKVPEGVPNWSVFCRYTVPGYAMALLISTYILWTFGRTDGLAFSQLVTTVLVLGFPAAVGAAAARLIL